jgi:hypothetical protein
MPKATTLVMLAVLAIVAALAIRSFYLWYTSG